MDRDELRGVQEPLKERYRDDPDAAVVTLTASGTLGAGITCNVTTGRRWPRRACTRRAAETGSASARETCCSRPSSRAPASRFGAVATSIGIEVPEGCVRAEGDLDFRGTLAVAKEAPVGFRSIRLAFELETDASDEELDTLLRLTERYCVVYQTIAGSPELSVSRAVAAG